MKFPKLISCILLILGTCAARADDKVITTREDAEALISTFKYQNGQIPLKGDLAKLNVPPAFRFLGPDDAQSILVRLWRNPPGPEHLGLLIPANVSPLDENAWVVTIDYIEDGHVNDDDAAKIDYNSLLSQMQKATEDENKERTAKGFPTAQLVGWAEPPRYDSATHKLYWAKDIVFGGDTEHTLNYNIRVLGRKGVLLLNVIAPISQLSTVEKSTPGILAMVDFQQGNRYSDYDSSTDKLATYGIAALVAGGVAVKMGLLKYLLVGILALKKFIIIGCAAISAWFRKLFKKKPKPGSSNSIPLNAPPEG
jgi:uncharacterized membrane-anchored protein